MTVTLKFKFKEREDLNRVLAVVKIMEQKAVNWLISNKRTSLKSAHDAYYHIFRQRFPDLHSRWIVSALKTATGIVHQFNKRKRKGKAKRPLLKKPFVSLNPELFRVSWDGRLLKVTIPRKANDFEPFVFYFKPHHKYRKLLDEWKAGKCKMGQITLTPTTISIPLQFDPVQPYSPKTVIGIDSNENSLDYFVAGKSELNSMDISEISRINRDHDRRVRKATRGKNNPKAKKKIQRKHGRLRKEKTKTLWCSIALFLVHLALHHQAALVLENLKGLKPNISLGEASRRKRQRLLNYWSIMTFHRILAMKCRQFGVPIVFVDPNGTSKSCPICGDCLRGQDKECPSCRLSRHYVAAINIACRGIKEFPGVAAPGQGLVSDPRSLSPGSKVVRWECAVTTGTCAN